LKRASRFTHTALPFFYLGISLSGLFMLVVLTLFAQLHEVNFPLQKPLIIIFFILICFLGILACVYPKNCLNILNVKGIRNRDTYGHNSISTTEMRINIVGHHPTCGKFSTHVISFSNRIYCAGCTGLVTGAIISILGGLIYLFISPINVNVHFAFFWLGFALIILGLIQHSLYDFGRSSFHLFINIIFPVGALFLVIGVNEIIENFFLNLFLLAFIIYWIFTRIILSKEEHRKICEACDIRSCVL
jgi:hypothetical protein